MPTRKNQIVAEITALENEINSRNERIEALKRELTETPEALLERDPEAERRAFVERKNDFLRKEGLLP